MMNEWLIDEQRFLGRALIDNVWHSALIILQPDLELHIFLPGVYRLKVNEERPKSIEGQVASWDIRIIDGPSSISFAANTFDSLNEKMKLGEEEKRELLKDSDGKRWTEITFMPRTCTFLKIGLALDIPDEWGLTIYPEKDNSMLFRYFNKTRSPRGLPKIFCDVDSSLYFNNVERWSLDAMQQRLKLFISCLSFFTGCPLSYELLVGRFNKEVSIVQIKKISNPNAYICPSPYNARIELKTGSLSAFAPAFVNKVERLFRSPERENILVLLSYFKMLYMAPFDEAKIAFSFQLMEALAKCKGIRLQNSLKNDIRKDLLARYSGKLCPSCYGLIEEELLVDAGDFNEYIEKALDAIMVDKSLDVNSSSIKEIARRYRNELFHGNFFEKMTHIDDMISTLPEGYQEDLPLVFQAIVAMIGVNFLFGIDFSEMTALKRRTY